MADIAKRSTIETLFRRDGIKFEREKKLPISSYVGGNQADFVIEDKIILECKANICVTKEDYYQIMRYLESSHKKLGILVNFRSKYLRPKRIAH